MSDLDVLRVPEAKTEPTTASELGKFTYRSWWCRKFHEKFMYTVGFSCPRGGVLLPIRVCRICLRHK